jgi:hypothetical protein
MRTCDYCPYGSTSSTQIVKVSVQAHAEDESL